MIRFIRKILPYHIEFLIIRIIYNILHREFRQKKTSFGTENKDKTFFVIRRSSNNTGILSNYHHVMGYIRKAIRKGYIPVVDMENYLTNVNEEGKINGTKNAWEYYFKQPTEYSLKDVYESANVILSNGDFPHFECPVTISAYLNEKTISKRNKIINNYLQFNDVTNKHINAINNIIFPKNKKILGVFIRGTDYIKLKPIGHPVQPTIEQLIEKIHEFTDEWNFEYIYLVNEEQETHNKFKEVFGDKYISTNSKRHNNYKENKLIGEVRFNRKNDRYHTNLDYLTDVVLLSRCDYFIGSIANGSGTALEINGNMYIDKYIFDLGSY